MFYSNTDDIKRGYFAYTHSQLVSTRLSDIIVPAAVAAVVEKHIVVVEMPRRDVAAVGVDLLPAVLPVELLVLVLGPAEQPALSPAQGAVAEHRS